MIDENTSYWPVKIAAEDRDKTKFASHHGLFRFIRMPSGLKNVPGTFLRAMDVILSSGKWQFALVYLDDMVLFSRIPDEHIDHVQQILTLL